MDVDDIVPVLILALAIGVALRGLAWSKLKTLGARSWPTMQGKIEFGTVIEQKARHFSYHLTQMAYSYAVNVNTIRATTRRCSSKRAPHRSLPAN
jgi:hypothetical protein